MLAQHFMMLANAGMNGQETQNMNNYEMNAAMPTMQDMPGMNMQQFDDEEELISEEEFEKSLSE